MQTLLADLIAYGVFQITHLDLKNWQVSCSLCERQIWRLLTIGYSSVLAALYTLRQLVLPLRRSCWLHSA